MGSFKAGSQELISSAVRETLDCVLSPVVRDQVLAAAFTASTRTDVPNDPLEFERFLHGSLREALLRTLGADLGDVVFEELLRVADTAISSMLPPAQSASRPAPAPTPRPAPAPRRNSPIRQRAVALGSPRPSAAPARRPSNPQGRASARGPLISPPASDPARPPSSASYPAGTPKLLGVHGAVPASTRPATSTVPQILVCSADSNLARRLAAWVTPPTVVLRIANLMGLLYAIEDSTHERTVVLLDCATPSIRPHSLAALADELPRAVQVLLWRCPTPLLAELARHSPRVTSWMVCEPEAGEDDAVKCCSRLMR
jgi:hypothetical protein